MHPYLMGMAKVKASTAVDKVPAKLSGKHDGHCTAFGFDPHVSSLRAFNICTTWGYWIDEKFLMSQL